MPTLGKLHFYLYRSDVWTGLCPAPGVGLRRGNKPCPRAIEFRAELPKRRVGKIDYKVLAQEHGAGHDNKGIG
jgi:acyl-CoA synthetase (AMP-forming)/AMP-acid ligase II